MPCDHGRSHSGRAASAGRAYPSALDFVCINQSTWVASSALPTAFFQDVAPVFRIEDKAGVVSPEIIGRVRREFIAAVEAWNIAARSTGLGMVVASVDAKDGRTSFNARLSGYLTA